MLHTWTILEELSVWKSNGPIHVCGPKINCHKSSEIDCKTRSVRKIAKIQLAKIYLDEKGNLLLINKVELDFAAHGLLSKLNKWDIITLDETKRIKKWTQCFVVSTLKKPFNRSPFKCESFRYCAVMNPVVSVSCEQKSLSKTF